MVIYVLLDNEGYIDGWGSSDPGGDSIEIEIEEDHPFFNDMMFKYIIKDNKIELSENANYLEEEYIKNKEREELINKMTPSDSERIEMLESIVLELLMEGV